MPFGKARYREQAMAGFRLLIALTFLFISPVIVPLAGSHAAAIHAILFSYLLFSFFIFARISLSAQSPTAFFAFVDISEIFWPSLLCLFTGCSNSPFFLLYAFALLAGSYRRKALETLLIALSSVLIVLFEDVFATAPSLSGLHLLAHPLWLESFAVKASILVLLGGFLAYTGFWNQQEQQAYATRSILGRLRSDAGFEGNLREILPAILRIFEAKKVVLVLRSSASLRVFQWGTPEGSDGPPIRRNVPASEEDVYFWPMPGNATAMACARMGGDYEWLALNRDGSSVSALPGSLQGQRLWERPFQTILATTLQLDGDWSGRIFLIDAACSAGREPCLRLLQHVADEVGPAVYNYYLWRHTSFRVRAQERQRIARDLHDGVVQSLIATELQLDVLRRQGARAKAVVDVCDVLAEAQESLRCEIRKLRAEMEYLRTSGVPRRSLPCLSEMLQNFEQATGIVASYSCNVPEQSIPRNVLNEMVRIVEESLSNVRRHSGARKVEVHLTAREECCEIVIQDDGCGFGFCGRMSLAQLDAARLGPRVIRERVHSANGELALESWPDRGARVEVRLATNG